MIRKIFDLWRAFVWWLTWPNNRKNMVACTMVLALSLCLTACEEKKETTAQPVMQIAVVDVEKILKDSTASLEGRQHLKQAQKRLQDGWEQLQKAWADAPQQDKGKVLADGFRALNAQMANEESAANRVVLTLMQEAVKEWRAQNNAVCVMAKQNLLDVTDVNDITAVIINMMDKKTPRFADLPKVQVHEPKAKEENKPAANKK